MTTIGNAQHCIFGAMFHFQDSLNISSKLSLKRVTNIAKVLGSYYASRVSGKPAQRGLPISISIEPTTACNLRCPECPSGLRSFSRATGNLKLHLLEKILADVSPHCTYVNFYFQGEPYIHPDFLKMIDLCRKYKMYSATSTNAHFLNDKKARETVESGLDRLIISIDGTDQETYSSYRREGSLEKVIEGTKNILKWKKELKSSTPHVIFQFLVVKPNQHQVEEVKKLGKELGVDEVRFKTAQIYDYENGSDLIPTIDKYSRYKKLTNGKYAIKNPLDNHCWRMWSGCVITWDGKVVPCCFDKDAHHQMGDLSTESFSQVWFSEPYAEFRSAVLRSRSEIEICKNCSEGTKVWS